MRDNLRPIGAWLISTGFSLLTVILLSLAHLPQFLSGWYSGNVFLICIYFLMIKDPRKTKQ